MSSMLDCKEAVTSRPSQNRRNLWTTSLFAVVILAPCLYGFGGKFIEFIQLYRGDVDGVFAISPILNYLLASLGFLFLFAWAVTQGMFRDIELPKHSMLKIQAQLDQHTYQPPGGDA